MVTNIASINNILKEITKRLVKEFEPEHIFLFGSYVWRNPTKDNDIDILVIVKNSDLTPAKRASLAFRCLRDIPYPLDIIIKTKREMEKFSHIPAALEFQVIHKAKLLYR